MSKLKELKKLWCCDAAMLWGAAFKNKDRSQSNLQIQCNPTKSLMVFFIEIEQS